MAKPKLSTKHMTSIYGGATERDDAGSGLIVERMLSDAHAPRKVVRLGGAGAEETRRMEAWIEQQIERGKAEPFCPVVTLTPVLATLLMSRNEGNRNLSPAGLGRFVRDAQEAGWSLNGETIVISREGLLNNGQHRCMAVIETGIPIRTFMAFGVTRESRLTLDQNIARTLGSYLKMNGFADATAAGSVASYIWQYEHLEGKRLGNTAAERPTKAQGLAIAERDREASEASSNHVSISDSLALIHDSKSIIGARSILAFCHWIIANRSGRVAADSFLTKLIEGTGLQRGSPILYARNRLQNKNERFRANEKIELILRAWNLHRAGVSGSIRVHVTGKFPVLEG